MLEKFKNILPGSSHLSSEQRSLGREIYKGIKKSKSNKVWYMVKVSLVCWEPGWGTPPVAKVMGKEAQHTQRWDRASGVPLEILEHLPPKPESACFTVVCFPPTLLTLTGGCPPPPHLFLEKVNLELLGNKSPGHNKSVSIQKPLWWLSSLPAGLLQLCMWLFVASRPARGTGSYILGM